MIQKIAIFFCTLWTFFIIASLVYLTPYTKPIKKGNLTEFCHTAFGVDHEGVHKTYDGYSPVIISGDQAIYTRYYLMTKEFKKVDKNSIESIFPSIKQHLEKQALQHDPNNYCAAGYLAWTKQEYVDDPNNFKILTDEIYGAYQKWQVQRGVSEPSEIYGYFAIADYEDKIILDKAKYFWVNYIFEFFFLSGLIWFIVWPVIKNKKFKFFAIRIGFAPLLTFLPFYLGYGIGTCDPFDYGGLLYPLIPSFFRGGYHCSIDRYLLGKIPRIMDPLNQKIGIFIPTEEWLDSLYIWGPIELLAIGLVLSGLLLLLHAIYNRIRNKRFANNDRIAIAKR